MVACTLLSFLSILGFEKKVQDSVMSALAFCFPFDAIPA